MKDVNPEKINVTATNKTKILTFIFVPSLFKGLHLRSCHIAMSLIHRLAQAALSWSPLQSGNDNYLFHSLVDEAWNRKIACQDHRNSD